MNPRTVTLFILILISTIPARAVTISQWTFETTVPITAGPHLAEAGASPGFASGFHANPAVYSNPVGNGSTESFSSTVWQVGDYYQFRIGTSGFSDIFVSFDQASSGTGPRDFKLAYSTDGSAFMDFQNYSVLLNAAPNPVWSAATYQGIYTLVFDLSAVTDVDNSSDVYFRLINTSTVSANDGTVAATGSSRVDNFTVTGSEIAAVPDSSPGLVGWGCALALLAICRLRWSLPQG